MAEKSEITIIIRGPQRSGKTTVAAVIRRALQDAGVPRIETPAVPLEVADQMVELSRYLPRYGALDHPDRVVRIIEEETAP